MGLTQMESPEFQTPRNFAKAVDFQLLHTEFTEVEQAVNKELFKVYSSKGGTFYA